MAHVAAVHLILLLDLIHGGLTALIDTRTTVVAAVGDNAGLNCMLMQSRDVLQVTWQKILPVGEENLATYTRKHGQRVNPDFRNKVQFREAGLLNSSIVLRQVTEQDEGCYLCMFNVFPHGAVKATTCLKLCELHEPILKVGGSESAEETLVSCSATGRPAPLVTLSVLQPDRQLSESRTVTVTNSNGTVTVTTQALLSGPNSNTQVGCMAQAPSGPHKVVVQTIEDQLDAVDSSLMLPAVIGASLLALIIICALVFGLRHKIPKSSDLYPTPYLDPEEIQTPEKQTLTGRTEEYSVKQENEVRPDSTLKKRTTPYKITPRRNSGCQKQLSFDSVVPE